VKVRRSPSFPLFHAALLWGDCYRGLDLVIFGTEVWIGWTNPVFKRLGW